MEIRTTSATADKPEFTRRDISWPCRRDMPLDFRALPPAEGQTADENLFELCFSSEFPVVRMTTKGEVDEILVHTVEAVDLSRASNGAALLVNHDPNQQVGVIESARVDTVAKKVRGITRFSRNPFPQQIRLDVVDGIRRLSSVGYDPLEWNYIPPASKDERGKLMITRWQVTEASIVAVPADTEVGYGRSLESDFNEPKNMNKTLHIADAAEGGTATATRVAVSAEAKPADYANERTRATDIIFLGNKWRKNGVTEDMVTDAINSGISANEFGTRILKKIDAGAPTSGMIGASETEIKRFSFARAIAGAASGKIEGLEGEMCAAAAKLASTPLKHERAFFWPMDVVQHRSFTRTNTAGSTTGGGYTVADELSSDFITYLRNNSAMMQAGVKFVYGLVGDQNIPAQTSGSTTNWGTEVESLGTSDLVWALKTATPKRAMARVPWSHQLNVQSLLPYEQILRGDVTESLMTAFDLAIIAGTGSGGQPTGITATSGIGAISNDAPAGFLLKDVLDAIADVKTANITTGRFAFVLNALAEAALSGTTVDSGSGQFLMQDGKIRGQTAFVTEQMANNYVLAGMFDQAMALMWSQVQILIDPYTLAATGITIINAEMFADVLIRRAAAFSLSANPAI